MSEKGIQRERQESVLVKREGGFIFFWALGVMPLIFK